MKTATARIEPTATVNAVAARSNRERFVVFVAGGKRSIISCSNYKRAERLALLFAGLTNVRMEVFDSFKEICYFVEPAEANVLSFIKRREFLQTKNKSGKQKNVMDKRKNRTGDNAKFGAFLPGQITRKNQKLKIKEPKKLCQQKLQSSETWDAIPKRASTPTTLLSPTSQSPSTTSAKPLAASR